MNFDFKRLIIRQTKKIFSSSTLGARATRAYYFSNKIRFRSGEVSDDSEVIILGHPLVTKSEWDRKKRDELLIRKQEFKSFQAFLNGDLFANTAIMPIKNEPEISVLISIYRPGNLLDNFLGELVAQTIFNKAEIAIVLVCPDLLELELISKFSERYPNVIYRVYDNRITIYEAWNIGIEMTSAPLITNMNIDDVRSHDSLQTQVDYMKSHPWVDVGFQDVYYFLDRDLDWTSIVNIGASSKLSAVTLTELAWFGINAPHNGPIWRRKLHDKYGKFDPSLRSAGDYEFWMRIALNGRVFAKMSKSTVGYFYNPEGMSTSTQGPSAYEERMLQSKYRDQIKLRSEIFSEMKVEGNYKSHPWDASEPFTVSVLDLLRGI